MDDRTPTEQVDEREKLQVARLTEARGRLMTCGWTGVFRPVFRKLPSSPGGVLSIFDRRGCAVFQGIVFAYFY